LPVRRWILCILLVIAPSAPHAQATSEFADIAAYVSELNRLHSALSDADPARAERLSVDLAPRWTVRTADGPVAVDLAWLVIGLRDAHPAETWQPRRAHLLRRLRQLQEHARASLAPSDRSGVALRAAVTRVLADGEFSRPEQVGWRERLQRKVGQWVQTLMHSVGMPALAGRTLALVIAWTTAVAAGIGLAVLLVRTVLRRSGVQRFNLQPDHRRCASGRELAIRAVHAFTGGDLREGTRLAWAAVLRAMEEQGAWRVDESRTSREYLSLLGRDDARGEAVRQVARLFELVFYADRPASKDDAERVRQSLQTLGCLHNSERAI
jgi:hypothetical protein